MTPTNNSSIRERITRHLTESQQCAVFHTDGPLLVVAGPGSGKTRVITCRIAALIDSGVRSHNICAITFTNKAATEMRQRTDALGAAGGAHVSTFHSLCVRILRRYADKAQIKSNFSIYDESDQTRCIKLAISRAELDPSRFTPSNMLAAVSTLKNKLITPENFVATAKDLFSKALGRVYKDYQRILRENNAQDFDDLLMNAALLLEHNDEVRIQLSNHFKFLLIDEYQDTNHAQYRIAKAIASEHNNICATGDPDQSIYRWRGADIRNIMAFEHDWPDAVVVKLQENFRSTAEILAAADALIARNINRKLKSLVSVCGRGAPVEIDQYENDIAEAKGIVENIKKLAKKGAAAAKIAVFYRVNAQSRAIEEALVRSRVPYQIVRGVEFYNRKEIRDMLAYLKVIANPDDEVALLRIINTPARGIGKTTTDRLSSYASAGNTSLFDALRQADRISTLGNAATARIKAFVQLMDAMTAAAQGPVAEIIKRIFEESGMEQALADAGPEGKNATENVNELINAASQYDEQTEQPSLIDYLQQVALLSDADKYDPAATRVALMTLHTAKGLEFDNVFIAGVEEGLLPHERSTESGDEMEEERRLLFVGITRAKKTLNLSFARYRKIRGLLLRTTPSPFLFELEIPFTPIQTPATPEFADLDPGREYDYSDTQIDPEFRPGQLVAHKKFGRGVIQKFTDMGENSIIIVRFNSGQTKSLKLKYANLLKVF
jgi:DNA helicase-2/ATP-dependent DNA helicase PcrA